MTGFILVFLLVPKQVKKSTQYQKTTNPPSIQSTLILMTKSKNAIALIIFGCCSFSVITAFAALWCIPFLETCLSQCNHLAAKMTSLIFIGCGLGAIISGLIGQTFSHMVYFKIHKFYEYNCYVRYFIWN